MSFTWNAWSPVNLGLDLFILASGAFIVRRMSWRSLPDVPSWPAVPAALGGGGLVVLPWLVGAGAAGGFFGVFLLARVLWTGATVGVPLAALALAFRWRKPAMLALALPFLALKFYGEVWCPNDLEVETVRVELPGLKGPVRLVHLSDLQTDGIGSMQLRAREAANAFRPDFVVFTGDVLNHPSLMPEVAEYLRGFEHGSSAFFVPGDVDGTLPLPDYCREMGFECLAGSAAAREVRGARLAFLGLGPGQAYDEAALDRLVRESEGAGPRVLLSHHPDALHMAREAPIGLHLSGHTHGGQVCLPWLGPIVTLSSVPRAIAAGGLHQVDGLKVLVSRGLGWEGHVAPRLRLLARPHLLLVELVPPP